MTLVKEVMEKLARGRVNCEWSCPTHRSCEVHLHLGEASSPSHLVERIFTREWEEILPMGEAHGWVNHLHDAT